MEYVEYERLSKVLISIRGCIPGNKAQKSFIRFFRRCINPANIIETGRRISPERIRYQRIDIDIVSELMDEKLEKLTLFWHSSRESDRMSLHLPPRFYLIHIYEDRECTISECHCISIENLLYQFFP